MQKTKELIDGLKTVCSNYGLQRRVTNTKSLRKFFSINF